MTDSDARTEHNPDRVAAEDMSPVETFAESASIDPVARLADEFIERMRRGEDPSMDAYRERYPEHAQRIGELFPMMLMLEQAEAADQEDLGNPSDNSPAPSATAGQRVGDFKLIREIGRGGMGVVYEAQQISLDRRVAVKLLPPHVAGNKRLMTRFQREARAAARLHHSNIVPVHEVGQDGKLTYYAMQLIPGQSLDCVLNELRGLRDEGFGPSKSRPQKVAAELAKSLVTPAWTEAIDSTVTSDFSNAGLDAADDASFELQTPADEAGSTARMAGEETKPSSVVAPSSQKPGSIDFKRPYYYRSIALIGIQVADALAHAHDEGILHRDIKPSNLLLDPHGRVWITDFGLAKTEDEGLTNSGDILGTLRYMPPERFRGKSDLRSDLYSLGITLYEMLALRPAFETSDQMSLIQQITHGTPPRLQSIEPTIPDDLETIIFKAIDRDPQRRYKNAAQLQLDLQRFLDDKPIAARRVTQREQLWRWCRRNPLVAGLLGALVALFLLGFAAVTVQWQRAEENAERAQQHAVQADRSANQAVQQAELAEAATAREKIARMAAESAHAAAEAARQRTRRLLYAAEMNLLPQAWEEANVGRMRDLLSPYRPAGAESDLRGFDWYYWWRRAHRFQASLDHGSPVSAVSLSPDGKTIVSAGGAEPVKLWDAATGEVQKVLEGPTSWVTAVAFADNGKWLAAGDATDVWLWNAETLSGGVLPHSPNAPVRAASFSPDGETLAAASKDGTIRFWRTADASLINTWDDNKAGVMALAWSPDGMTLAVATGDWGSDHSERRVFLRNIATEATRHLPAATGPLTLALDFSPNGRFVAAGGTNDVLLLDLREGTADRLDLHTDIVSAVAFSPDGEMLASAGSDRRIHLLNVAERNTIATLRGHGKSIQALVFSTDGKRLISGSDDQRVNLWENLSAEEAPLEAHEDAVRSLAVSPSGEQFATAGADGTVRLWELESAKQQATLQSDLKTVNELVFTPDGQRIVIVGNRDQGHDDGPGGIEVWDLSSDRQVYQVENPDAGIVSVAVSPDGRWLAAGDAIGVLRLWNLADGTPLRTFNEATGGIRTVAFSHDGRRLASGGHNQPIRIWDPETAEPVAVLEDASWSVWDLAFSPDGRSLVSAGQDGNVRLWDLSKQTLAAILQGHAKVVTSIAFSPDGKTLATASGDRTIRLWDWTSGRQTGRLAGHDLGIHALSFSPKHRTLISADLTGQVRLWRAASDEEIAAHERDPM